MEGQPVGHGEAAQTGSGGGPGHAHCLRGEQCSKPRGHSGWCDKKRGAVAEGGAQQLVGKKRARLKASKKAAAGGGQECAGGRWPCRFSTVHGPCSDALPSAA